MNICEANLPTKQFIISEPCTDCNRQYIRRSSIVTILDRSVIVTVSYEHCVKPLGFALGRHVYSITLLPGEEIQLEVTHSSKTTQDTSREMSTEQAYTQEFADTVQEETSHKDTSNFKICASESGGIDIDIFSAKGSNSIDYESGTEDFHKQFKDVSSKAAAKTDRKFDVHIDVKSEVTDVAKSTRTIRNFNQCQTVTYHYFQIARKYRNELRILDVRFSLVGDKVPDVYAGRLPGPLVHYRVQPPRPSAVLTSPSIAPAPAPVYAGAMPAATALRATLDHPTIGNDPSDENLQLTLPQLLALLPAPQRAEFQKELTDLLGRLGLAPGKVVADFESCMNTSSLYADAMTGECAACDTHTVMMQELERQKAALEIQRLKLNLASLFSVTGYVRSATGGVANAIISIRGPSGELIAQEPTDDSGLFGFAAAPLLVQSRVYTAAVETIPPPYTSTSSAVQFTWSNAQQRIEFVLA